MKRTSLAVLMIALALVALAAPLAYAQAPAPKVTINGLIDNLTSYSQNNAVYNGGVFNRKDSMWYGRTRGRFDIIGEVGKAKGVLGLEIDAAYGQTGAADNNISNTAAQQCNGCSGGFDLNTDVRTILEVKWLYVEFPMPLIPVPTTARLGAQPFGAAATYKLGTYATGDFPGVNIVSQITPNFKLAATYVQVEENLAGTQTRSGLAIVGSNLSTQTRGDDFAYILSPEITPFKGLDIKPMFSMFYAQGTTSGSARGGRGGLNTTTAYTMPTGDLRGGINEYRYTVGLDSRLRMGPFSLDPTIMYQFGNKAVIAPATFAGSGAVTGRKYYPNMDAWLLDVRAGFQLGPLLLEGLAMYSTGNSRRNNTLGTVRYYQPLDTDTSYLADWGTSLTSLGLDYFNPHNAAAGRIVFPGNLIGWDKYGRVQVGAKATYAITPELSVMAGANLHWAAEKMDRDGTPVAGAGITPVFAGPRPRGDSGGWGFGSDRFVGTELMALVTWRFAPGLTWDNQFGYMFMGPALDGVTDPAVGARNTNDPFMLTSRIRFTF